MPFDIRFTPTAADHVRGYRKYDQQIILEGIETQLRDQPHQETTNRKHLGANELSDWELRIGKFRVFYDVEMGVDQQLVKVKAVGHKIHNRLIIAGREIEV